jgi:hypothetical protein
MNLERKDRLRYCKIPEKDYYYQVETALAKGRKPGLRFLTSRMLPWLGRKPNEANGLEIPSYAKVQGVVKGEP